METARREEVGAAPARGDRIWARGTGISVAFLLVPAVADLRHQMLNM